MSTKAIGEVSSATTTEQPKERQKVKKEEISEFWASRILSNLSIIPFASIPVGIGRAFYATKATGEAVFNIIRSYAKYQWQLFFSGSQDADSINAKWVKEYGTQYKILSKIGDVFARAFLELVPFAGNLGIYYSVWHQGENRTLETNRNAFARHLDSFDTLVERLEGLIDGKKQSEIDNLKKEIERLRQATRPRGRKPRSKRKKSSKIKS